MDELADTVFEEVTELLSTIADYDFTGFETGDAPQAISGLFDVIEDLSDFATTFSNFVQLVEEGKILFSAIYFFYLFLQSLVYANTAFTLLSFYSAQSDSS